MTNNVTRMSYDFKSQPHSQRKQKKKNKTELKAQHVAHVIAIVTVNCNCVGNVTETVAINEPIYLRKIKF